MWEQMEEQLVEVEHASRWLTQELHVLARVR